MFTKQKGQSLIEVLIALTVTVIMIVALIAFVLSGLKNSQFAQKQSKATKIATETMDQIKTIRDRNGVINFGYSQNVGGAIGALPPFTKFSDLWTKTISNSLQCVTKCYFSLQSNGALVGENTDSAVDIGDGFKRQIIFEDSSPLDSSKEKRVTINIFWTDSTGDHNSNIQTILSPAI